jgi:carboxyl-terminal processing protease
MSRRRLLLALWLLLGPLLGAAELPPERLALLTAIAEKLPPDLHERWASLRREHEPRLADAQSTREAYTIVNGWLDQLGASHFHLLPPAPPLPVAAAPQGPPGWLGLAALPHEQRILITEVAPDSPAAAAGLRPGWALLAVKGQPLAPLLPHLAQLELPPGRRQAHAAILLARSLAAAPGEQVKLTVADAQDAERDVTLTAAAVPGPAMTMGHLPPLYGTVTVRRLPGEVGYVRLPIFMMPLLEPLKQAVAELADTRALVLDLRGNPGGIGFMAAPVAGLFCAERTSLGTSQLTGGHLNFVVFPAPQPYRQPLVVLVDETSASTAEILAAGLQELGRARVVGRPTAGEVLPSIVEELPDGSRLQHAVADFVTPKGVRLEGRGVTPDVTVPLTRESLLRDGDPILAAALAALAPPPPAEAQP